MSESSSSKSNFIREIIAADLANGKHATTITRFPPEPNGYLHIGHAKAICLNFGIALENASSGAECHLRFDDTNPSKEEVEYVESIQSDVSWLGFDWGQHLYYASNYFEYFHDCAVALIEKGLAYVDQQTADEIKATRGNLTEPGTPSPWRDRPVAENLDVFARMRAGDFKEGEAVLRAKIDMAAPNVVMRDPVIYRVMHAHHHNTGDAWCIYPMYDFAHPLEDAKEHITHSLCTLEFEIHRPFYDWVIEHCPVPSQPRQIEFARLNLSYTVMSKRKLLQLVKEGHVGGWDDPRMPTISGLRRRGVPPQAIRNFCERIGITKFNGVTDVALLEFEIRDFLNKEAPRRMAVLDPVKLVITNYEEGRSEEVDVPNNPEKPEEGCRRVKLTREVWIERDDFMEDPPKKFFRLFPGGYVRLRGGYILHCTGFTKGPDGLVTEIHCEYLHDTIGKDAPEGVKCKAAIHWVSVEAGISAEVRLYDRLFTVPNPDGAEGGFVSVLNPDSLHTLRAWVEPALAETAPEGIVQFERIGYFVADRKDHVPGAKPVFNRTVALRDSWGKKA
ncbi:glutaminyl-tRNA synthetase [Haloferula luteola]|uniref:Glutamine--tRNA ligase n=1 Tax=Haloferula luteola TaxID=595692 RepID=A0A840V2D7_9BACT|nr:glutamine--tRNA ligase/YqeY domain fusion protein [Haloferula luteola]MBB5349834.1 glutaminyl-tRNA synthetase [Haloferula luteola]